MKKLLIYLFSITVLVSIIGCEEIFLGEIEDNTILNNLDYFDREFQNRYGLFDVRDVDWKQLVESRRAALKNNPTEEALYQALTSIILELDDSHVSLSHPAQKFKTFEGGRWGKLDRAGYQDMDLDIVLKNYLTLKGVAEEERAYYGTVDGNIGYIYLPEIHDAPDFWESYMPRMINDLSTTVGLIVDIRNNDGGEDESSRTIAGYFADQRNLYMKSRYRNGPNPRDFGKVFDWYVEPADGTRYLKPIILLTNRYTISAGETLTLAMKTLPHVTHMGDTTCGAFSDAVSRQLPNGWQFSLSVGDYRDAANVSHEGVGLIPEVVLRNTASDLEAGVDVVLEEAMRLLR